MSDLKDEDLLLGDDIDDQALCGADEDELLLTDEELEKDVTNEEKQQIKAEAEQWVREQMQEQHKRPQKNKINSASNGTKAYEHSETSVNRTNVAPVTTTDVSSTATYNDPMQEIAEPISIQTAQGVHSTSEASVQRDFKDSKAANENNTVNQIHVGADSQSACKSVQNISKISYTVATNAEDTISSSSKDVDMDHTSLISCSTTELITDSSIIPSSQESITTGVSAGGASRDYTDPREDCDDEREERTNIKTTNERDVESASSSDQSPDLSLRYSQNKRIPGDGPHSIIRPHRYSARPPYHSGPPRAMLNRAIYPPMPHGNFPLAYTPANVINDGPLNAAISPNATATLIHNISAPSQLPGHFPIQHPASNTPPHNMYAPQTATHSTQQQTHGGLPPSPPNPMNSVPSSHEMMPRLQLRHPYSAFRPNAPMPNMGGNFRHPIHGSGFNPHDYNGNGPNHGLSQYGQNFLPNPPIMRGMFRPEIPQGLQPRLPPPAGIRIQRAPLQQHNLPGTTAFPSNVPRSGVRPQIPPQQPGQTGPPNIATNKPNVASLTHGVAGPVPGSAPAPALRPSKVLINPNFKGGVEAATSKFIQETQYMASIGGVPRSDEELLRQQEEFINKNRQHIEKRRHERAASPPIVRRGSRSRSRSRTRSRSRERSYSPPSKRAGAVGGGERHFERERERDRDRERERERDRGGGVRDRGGQMYGNRVGGNRFRRGNSRDRGPGDYDIRGGSGGGTNNYNKRRRSISPSGNRGSGSMMGGRRRSGDRDRNEEDDETRAYRLQIEKQKELREKIMRDKEMKRRRAAEEKQHEEKRGVTQTCNSNPTSSSQTNKTSNNNSSSHDEPQKLKPIIVTQPKIISLKKRQQQNDLNNERQRQRSITPPSGPQPRKQLPTAKILPEAKRTLTEHLTSVGSGGNSGGISGHSNNTAIIKPVQKTRETSKTQTPPLPPPGTMTTSSLPSKHTRRLSTPSDDEVQLDYDDDELMLDEEDRLLATPTPSPKHRTAALSRTPSPESPLPIKSSRNKTQKMSTTSSGVSFSSSNRRVVLKQSNERSRTKSPGGRIRRGNSRQRDIGNNSGNSSHSNRKGIFDRLDVRSSGSNGSGTGSESKRKAHRIVLKHD